MPKCPVASPPAPLLPEPWLERLEEEARARRALGRERRISAPEGLDFASNDYLGLRQDPRVQEAAIRAARQYGAGVGAARLLRGTTPLHEALERELASWKGSEACLLFNTGYQCNATLLPSLLRAGDIMFSDALNHASLVDGCRMAKASGARLEIYRHGDLGDLQNRLKAVLGSREPGALRLVATDAIFSMDGDAADLPGLLDLCRRHEALLLVDEAHATGLLGPTGAGLAEAQGVRGEVPLLMGTLGKALAGFGAFVCCATPLREHLVNTCRGFLFSTALPPPVVGAALEARGLAESEPWRRERALAHAGNLRKGLGLPPHPSAIVPLVLGSDRWALEASAFLRKRGFDVRAVRPPTVPEGSARLRITTGAHLEATEVQALLEVLQSMDQGWGSHPRS